MARSEPVHHFCSGRVDDKLSIHDSRRLLQKQRGGFCNSDCNTCNRHVRTVFEFLIKHKMKNAFRNAVNNNDVDTIEALLAETSSLVEERYSGEAWVAGCIYDSGQRKQIPAPADFPFTNTALHTASVNGRTDLTSLLIRYGTDINAIGYEANKGLTPAVVLAAWEGSLETLRVLLENGADPNNPASAETALYTAAEHHSFDKVELLLAHGARHDIFTAAITGNAELVERMLVAYPPLQEARSEKRGRTPREEAEHHGQSDVVKLF